METPSLEAFLIFLLLSLLPTIELRGSIPYGLVYNFNPYFTVILAIITSSMVFFPIYHFLNFYQKNMPPFCRSIVEKTRIRGQKYVDKYGLLGLAIFVAIPFPGSGVWSGSVIAWLLGIKWYKAFISIFTGNIVAGLMVFLVATGFLSFKLM
ncbi:MAG: COG2426 family protein [Candidatus Bathyarchaeota archaeon]